MSTMVAHEGNLNVKKGKPKQVRDANIIAAKALGDAVRTSLGPKGMDKMIIGANNKVTISNDGATLLQEMMISHPIGQMLVDVSKSQDIEAGDGTTSVVVLAASLLEQASKLINKGVHPTKISEGYQIASDMALQILKDMSTKVDLSDRENLLKIATTSLSSKVVYQHASLLAPIAVDAVMNLVEDVKADNVQIDLNDIKIVKKHGGTIEETELFMDGFVLTQNFNNNPSKTLVSLEKAKVGLIQFCISPPKTNMESSVIVKDYSQMDRVLREEKMYILNICKAIQKTGINVLLIQKSILRDSITELGLHFLTKMGIYVIKNVEREEVEYICRNLGCSAISSLEYCLSENLAVVDKIEEKVTGTDKYIVFSGVKGKVKTSSIIIRGSNDLVLEEADRSLHDALCVIRAIVKSKYMIVGGGAPETEMSVRLKEYSNQLKGTDAICVRAFSEAFHILPITLAENAGLNAVPIMAELRKLHSEGFKNAGINIISGKVEDLQNENVIQPLLVNTSAVKLATEAVRCILKIDDVLQAIR